MYVVYSNCLYFLSIFLFNYNKFLLPPPPPPKKNVLVAPLPGHAHEYIETRP